MFPDHENALLMSMKDVNHPLASYSRHEFELDDARWPSVEHYFQALRFEDLALREAIRCADHPDAARKLAHKQRRRARKDWETVQVTYMTRGVYVKTRTHQDVADALLASGERRIVESSQYDYFWGCGRDTRGHNHFGRVLMAVRSRLREETA
ncbi:MAG: NADAR family protein [Pseudomonadales bacterium]